MSESDNAATTYGFEIDILDGAGNLNLKAVALFSICGVVTLSLFAMIFRNLYLIIKNSGEIAVGMEGFITGILVLFLTQIFTYGAQLQKDFTQ